MKHNSILSAEDIIKKVERLKGARVNWDNHWQEIAEFMLPRKDTILRQRSPGEQRHQFLLDNTGMQSLELLAGALHSLLTNPNRPFFELTTGDEQLDENDSVRSWMQDSARRMHNVLNNSNFQTEVHELYIDLCAFGTAPMSIEEDDDTVVRFRAHSIGNIFIEEDNKGRINRLYRPFRWDAENIIREFGERNVPKIVLDVLNNPDLVQPSTTQIWEGGRGRFSLIQAIYPRDLEDIGVNERMKFISQWIFNDTKTILRTKGFREFPFVVPRWLKSSDEIYGRSPAMVALPDVKTVNKMDEVMLIGAQKVVDPPLQMPDDGFVFPIMTVPGGINFYRPGTSDRITPIFNDARIDFGFQMMGERRERIRKSFFVDQLRLSEGPQMTATEVLQRTEDSMRLLSPVLGRQQSEFLRPLISRVFDIMIRRDMFLDAPQVLEGRSIDFQYSSLIAKAQRVAEGQNILRTMEMVSPFIQLDPSVADNINGDEAFRVIARIHGMDQRIVRDQDEVEERRESRAQAQEEAAAAEDEAARNENIAKAGPTLVQASAAES